MEFGSIVKKTDGDNPANWSLDKRLLWEKGEQTAFEIYGEETRFEGSSFFDDYLLLEREPLLGASYIDGSIVNTYYYYGSTLQGFTSLFLCNFHSSGLKWHGLDVGNSIGIIPRKTFSIRSPKMVDSITGIPFVRIDNIKYVQKQMSQFPTSTVFTLCAHFQPESYTLIQNIIKLVRRKKLNELLRASVKLKPMLNLIPGNIIETFSYQEKKEGKNEAFIVARFTN